jgi:hypothetical protein
MAGRRASLGSSYNFHYGISNHICAWTGKGRLLTWTCIGQGRRLRRLRPLGTAGRPAAPCSPCLQACGTAPRAPASHPPSPCTIPCAARFSNGKQSSGLAHTTALSESAMQPLLAPMPVSHQPVLHAVSPEGLQECTDTQNRPYTEGLIVYKWQFHLIYYSVSEYYILLRSWVSA